MEKNKNCSNLGIYGADIKKFKLLSLENEKKLCNEMANGNISSRNELITSNLNLVIKIAMQYRNRGVELDELISEGNKGLIIASMKFNPKFDNKFSTYAFTWIKQSILSAIETNNKWNPKSYDNVLNDDYYDEKDLSVDMTEFECDDSLNDIIRRIDGLPKRDGTIMKHYFGLSGYGELNTIELSEKFNISTMRISSIIENSIRKIRCEMLENI